MLVLLVGDHDRLTGNVTVEFALEKFFRFEANPTFRHIRGGLGVAVAHNRGETDAERLLRFSTNLGEHLTNRCRNRFWLTADRCGQFHPLAEEFAVFQIHPSTFDAGATDVYANRNPSHETRLPSLCFDCAPCRHSAQRACYPLVERRRSRSRNAASAWNRL